MNIYYFSGTGNTFHIANKIASRFEDSKMIPIVSELKKNSIIPTSDVVIILFPIYLNTTPSIVKEFLKRIDLNKVSYVSVITTNCGYPGYVGEYVNNILSSKGKCLDSYFTLKMMGNSGTGLMPKFMFDKKWPSKVTKKNIYKLEDDMVKDLDKIILILKRKESNMKEVLSKKAGLNKVFIDIGIKMNEKSKTNVKFYIDSDCIGCDKCERVCLSGKIKIVDNRPIWDENIECLACYACYNHCPEKAILVEGYPQKEVRYVHPMTTFDDIANQKQ